HTPGRRSGEVSSFPAPRKARKRGVARVGRGRNQVYSDLSCRGGRDQNRYRDSRSVTEHPVVAVTYGRPLASLAPRLSCGSSSSWKKWLLRGRRSISCLKSACSVWSAFSRRLRLPWLRRVFLTKWSADWPF